ncbi:MAG: aminopeptidase P family protein [Erysipelotrichaceae bacterium]
MNKHLEKICQICQNSHYQNLIFTDYYNLYYLTELTIDSGERMIALLINKNGNYLFVNHLFNAEAIDGVKIIYYDDIDDPIQLLASYLVSGPIGIDGKWQSSFLFRLMDCHQAEYSNCTSLIAECRLIKDFQEQQYMIKASLDNDAVMKQIVPYLKLGVSEKEIHNILISLFEKQTHETVSFDPIVAFGKNCGDPHHLSDDTLLTKGDNILIDMGSHYQHYCSDMTRTFLQNDTYQAIYDIVKTANQLAIAAINTSTNLAQIDKVARDYISSFGYGANFTHRLGHGIGLEVHEPYDVSSSSNIPIKNGMCFSIEPGIYIKGVTGVRIEDLVLVKDDKAVVLNSFTKENCHISL